MQKGGNLSEEIQVSNGEVEGDGLLHVDHDCLLLLDYIGVVLQHDAACAEVT